MNQSDIQRILPHRYPFLLIDRVTKFLPARRIEGIKTFTANEAYGASHFFVVPCGILLEMITQLGAILVLERPEMKNKIAMILQIPSAEMRAPAGPGDTVRAVAEALKLRETFGELEGKIYRGRDLIAEGRMRFAIANVASIQNAFR
ncbi:MAG: 3-hydroxyacyl-ACP dehydratase FabZ family protein [Terriglobia bacterium]